MFEKTSGKEKTQSHAAADSTDKLQRGGKTMPAVKPAQLAADEEEKMQMKTDPVQKEAEEEEKMQMKADPVQKEAEDEKDDGGGGDLGDEEKLQMKADPVQKEAEDEKDDGGGGDLGDEEKLQMKADPVQKEAEDEKDDGGGGDMGDEEKLQMKADPVQKEAEDEKDDGGGGDMGDEEKLQMKADPVQRKAAHGGPFQLKKNISRDPVQRQESPKAAANKTGMPNSLKSGVENLSGFSMDDVKVHYNSDKPKQLQALAYAQGTDIHVAPGQEKHLPHEAWHVAQQKQGRVQPTVQMKEGVPVNDDAGLEHEADVMGAQALSAGTEAVQKKEPGSAGNTAQLKFNTALLSKHTAQRVAVAQREEPETATMDEAEIGEGRARSGADAPKRGGVVFHARRPRGGAVMESPADKAFKTENAGMINMITNAGKVLTSVNWTADAPGASNLDNAITGGTAVGGLTGVAATVTNKATGAADVGAKAIGAAGHVVASVGSSIGSLVSAVTAIKKAYEEGQKEKAGLVGSTLAAQAMLSALKSGFEAAASVQRFVSGSVDPAIIGMIPGLGIAIAACDIVMNAYTAYNGKQAEAEMDNVSGEFRLELTKLIGIPEDYTGLFHEEKRGQMGNRQEYLRLKPGLFEELDVVKADKTGTMEAGFKARYGIDAGVNFAALYAAIKNYELGSKMQEINQKRKVHGAREVFTSVIKIAGEIAKFFPADGAITATVLTGVAAGISGGQKAAKAIQGMARDGKIGGGDKSRSGKAKHKEYLNHTKSIFEYLDGVPKPVLSAQAGKVNTGRQLLAATGVSVPTVLATDYSDTKSVQSTVDSIVAAMKTGR